MGEEYKMTLRTNLKYSFFILLFMVTVPLIGLGCFLFSPVPDLGGLLKGCLLCSAVTGMFWLPGILLHLSYYFNDKKKEIHLTQVGMELIKENTSYLIKYQDILRIEKHIGNNSWRLPWNDYGFVKITTNDNKMNKITCLLIDPSTLILILSRKCKCEIQLFAHGIPYF